MSRLGPKSSRPRTTATLLAALFALALSSGAASEDAQLLETRRQHIGGMTHSEILQLKRNYDEFRKLSPERRNELVQLHNEVQQDTKSGGRLQKLLAEYNAWFSNLSPFDRERILSKTDPIERAQLVKTVRDEQKKRQANLALAPARRARRANALLTLSPQDLDAISAAIEEKFLTPDSRHNIPTSLTDRERHVRVLKLAQLQIRTAGRSQSPTETNIVSIIAEAVPDSIAKNRILKHSETRERQRFLGQVLARSLFSEWRTEIEPLWPAPAVLEAEITRKIATAGPARRETLKNRLQTFDGRRMLGVELALQESEKFGDLRIVFNWLTRGFPTAGPRSQASAPTDSAAREEESAESPATKSKPAPPSSPKAGGL